MAPWLLFVPQAMKRYPLAPPFCRSRSVQPPAGTAMRFVHVLPLSFERKTPVRVAA